MISKITQPTEWCAGMVVAPKPNGNVRICVDLTRLNNSVRRERHPLPSVDQVLAQLAGAKIFSKLDANSGFWQIPLAEESIPLTTFMTPFGRYCFHRLPFGITSAPEHFQRRMSEMVGDMEGVVCLIDDFLIYGSNQQEHDERLTKVLTKLGKEGLTLNKEKCKIPGPYYRRKWHKSRPRESGCDPEDSNPNERPRSSQIPGNSKPDEQICTEFSRDQQTDTRSIGQRQPVDMGRTTAKCIRSDQRDANNKPCLSSFRPNVGHNSLSRCILLWPWSHTPTETSRWESQTDWIHLKIDDSY